MFALHPIDGEGWELLVGSRSLFHFGAVLLWSHAHPRERAITATYKALQISAARSL